MGQHKMLVMRTDDLEERTKDVHMLRVTKDLQSLLHGAGEDSRAKAEAELLERKIAHLYAAVKRKEENLGSTYNGYDRAVKMKQRENAMLAKKLGELQQNVMQREHIREGQEAPDHRRWIQSPHQRGGGRRCDGPVPRAQAASPNHDAAKKHT